MTDQPDFDNRTYEMKWDAEVLKIIEQYAGLDAESAKLTEKRSDLRAAALEKHGIESYDLQSAVYKLKRMTKTQREAHEAMVARIVKASEGRQAEFWPKDAARTEKRAANKAAKKAKAEADAKETAEAQERRVAADANPRNAPKIVLAGDSVIPDNDDAEQAEGEAALQAMAPETNKAKLSQSEQAAKKRAEALLN